MCMCVHVHPSILEYLNSCEHSHLQHTHVNVNTDIDTHEHRHRHTHTHVSIDIHEMHTEKETTK